MICSSLNRFRFMSVLPERTQLYYVRVSGEQVTAYNNTPRKCLGFKSPPEILSAQSLHFKLESTGTLRFIQNAS